MLKLGYPFYSCFVTRTTFFFSVLILDSIGETKNRLPDERPLNCPKRESGKTHAFQTLVLLVHLVAIKCWKSGWREREKREKRERERKDGMGWKRKFGTDGRAG